MPGSGVSRRKISKPTSQLGPRRVPEWTTVLAPVAAAAFDELEVSVSLRGNNPVEWYPIHLRPSSIIKFEFEHGVGARRYAYNERGFEAATASGRPLLGEHAGFHDLFVPVGDEQRVWGFLVVGPFARAPATRSDILERWHAMTLRQGRLTDPSFADYVATTLSTLTLPGALFNAFERFMTCFARLLGKEGDPRAYAAEAGLHRLKLQEARYCERTWTAARALVDPRTHQAFGVHAHETLAFAGLKQLPQHVIVGLLRGKSNASDPLDDLLRRDAFQRACVHFARKLGACVSGKVGDYGVTFLVDSNEPDARLRTQLLDIASKATSMARRFGLKLHTGIAQATGEGGLTNRYHQAFGAAEKALSEGRSVALSEPRPERSAKRLRDLREQLGASMGDSPNVLSPRFERYIESVALHCGYRTEWVRAELGVGLQRLAEPLLRSGALDERAFDDMCAAVDASVDGVSTVAELCDLYRRLVSDIQNVLKSPTLARQDRNLQRALEYIAEHLSERLTLTQVSRVAGFAPGYFSKLFKREQAVSFESYVRRAARAR